MLTLYGIRWSYKILCLYSSTKCQLLGRCFRFVCIYACTAVNKDLYISAVCPLFFLSHCMKFSLYIVDVTFWRINKCPLLPMFRGLSVCLSVCWTQRWALQKRLNQSRRHSGCGTGWSQGTVHVLGWSPDCPQGYGHFRGWAWPDPLRSIGDIR